MKVETKPFKQIDREYRITSAELRKALKIEGEITDIGLEAGRSPAMEEDGISADTDVWYIKTKEIVTSSHE